MTRRLWDEPEADQFARIARELGVPADRILIENQSTNTGENVRFTRRLLESRGLDLDSFILVQKPYMERRSYATFRKVWPEKKVVVTSPVASLDEYLAAYSHEALSPDDVISIMVGDLQRIREYPAKGFQIPQVIPDDVWYAYLELVEAGYDRHLIGERRVDMTTRSGRPGADEAAEYYFTYINQAPGGDVCDGLEGQLGETLAFLSGISEEASGHRYAPDRWSIKQVLSHVNDTERAFAFRALWFARGFSDPLPSFDQNIAVAGADADARPWMSHVDEFRVVRSATVALFRGLPDEAWMRRGTASGNVFTVRALAHIAAGHVAHHNRLLREKYL